MLMLISTKHGVYPAHKCTIAGILTYMSRISNRINNLLINVEMPAFAE